MRYSPKQLAFVFLLGIGIWIMLVLIVGTLFLGGCGPVVVSPDVGTDAPRRPKTLQWNPNALTEEIDFYTVYMCGNVTCGTGSLAFRLGTTTASSFTLPMGPYTRSFMVTSSNSHHEHGLSIESPKSQPITTHL